MSAGNQPFSELIAESKPAPGAPRRGWIAAGILAAAAVALLALWIGKLREVQSLRSDLVDATNKLADANTNLRDRLVGLKKVKDQLATVQSNLADLEQEKTKAEQKGKGLEDEMRSALESRDVTISNLQGKLTVNILDRVMFDSGEAILKPDGESVLRKVAGLLAGHPELKIQVIGHTDNVPIRTRFPSNWELSAARALAAVHFLTEKAGVDPRRVGAAGYGEYRPIADNSTAEGRARNRRIAIAILPEELASADAAPAARPDAAADTQPKSEAPPAPAEPPVK
jgi:chemotaxis protein MotB